MDIPIRDLPVAELAALVCQALADHRIEAILTGGAVVSIYSENRYESKDLDFVAEARDRLIERGMASVGFERRSAERRYFVHPDTPYFVEFPSPPLAIGHRLIRKVAAQDRVTGRLLLLTPTQSVMDRLAAYYHWGDRQAFAQALLVADRQPIDWDEVEAWSREEGSHAKFLQVRRAAKRRPRGR
jgi:hypothetical protein